MTGHLGDVNRTAQNLEIARVDVERGLLLVKGAVPGSKTQCRCTHCSEIERGEIMDIKLLNAQGQESASSALSDAVFGR